MEAEAAHAADVAPYGRAISADEGVIVLSHTGGTGYSMTMLERAREAGAETLHISGIGNGGELETVAGRGVLRLHGQPHRRAARLAQIATASARSSARSTPSPSASPPCSTSPAR